MAAILRSDQVGCPPHSPTEGGCGPPARPRGGVVAAELAEVEARRNGGEGPDTGHAADALGLDGVLGADAHQDLFKEADVGDDSEFGSERAQIEDGIGDKLSGTVKGDIAAAIDLVNLNATGGEQLARGDDVALAGVAAQGDDRRMLDEEQHVANALLLAELDERLLQAQSGCVIAAAEIEDGNHARTRILRAGTEGSRFLPRTVEPIS